MGKVKDKKHGKKHTGETGSQTATVSGNEPASGASAPAEEARAKKLTGKEFEAALEPLQVELVKLQGWVQQTGAKICILFEGRDTAGKGGVIKRITERVSPRVFRVVALPAPTDREKSQMYAQRYITHMPAGGEVVLFH